MNDEGTPLSEYLVCQSRGSDRLAADARKKLSVFSGIDLQRRSAEHADRPTANDSRGKVTISPYLQRRPTTLMNLQCIYSAGVRHLSNTDSGACGRGIINAHSLQHSRYIVFFATFTIHCPFNYRGTMALENPVCTPVC